MILSLEVLQAKHGDCLILHFDKGTGPQIIVIDGGPATVYSKYLKKRLLEIKETLSPDEPLPISMVMVSHLDDDHANGICAMMEDIAKLKSNNKPQFIKPVHFWFNTFDDIIGNIQLPKISAAAASAAANEAIVPKLIADNDHHLSAVIASTSQGRQLRDNATTLGFVVNSPFKGMGKKKLKVVRGDSPESKVKWEGLTITVIHPDETRMQELQAKWDKDLEEALAKGDDTIIFASLKDKSPFNLSSIVCVVELGGKRMLLTGDGRCDDIEAGLIKQGFLPEGGKIHFDILKMPHHGSERNMMPEFLQSVTADHYVISADGKHDNPDQGTLDMIVDNVKKGTIHFTNEDDGKTLKKKMDDFQKALKKKKSKVKVKFRGEEDVSFVLDLLDKVKY